MKTIELSEHIPRIVENYSISFNYGLLLQQFLLYFLLFGGLQLALTVMYLVFFKNHSFTFLGLALCMIFVSYISYREIKNIKHKIAVRKEVFIHGKPITATVIGHTKTMVYYKSAPDYMLHVQLKDDNQRVKLRCKNSQPFKQYPKGSEIIGLQYGDNILFGPSVNRVFVLK